jgi:hypothetical protein
VDAQLAVEERQLRLVHLVVWAVVDVIIFVHTNK